ncbi:MULTISPECIES: hypothetical protein [unclassified Mesorhizobium]|uniref:hypothetical protein n=1 Tax=unclassified Mesorhizobium TaxID=325217 RepID=UPI003337866A
MSAIEKQLRQQIGMSRQAEYQHRRYGREATRLEAAAFAAALLFCAAITIGLV